MEKNEPSDNWFRRGQEENQVRRQVGCARWIGGRCFTWKHRLPSRWTMFRKRLPSPAGLRRALRRQRRLALAPQNASEERVDRPERPPGGWWHGGWRRLAYCIDCGCCAACSPILGGSSPGELLTSSAALQQKCRIDVTCDRVL